jgi:hypothetical protein
MPFFFVGIVVITQIGLRARIMPTSPRR